MSPFYFFRYPLKLSEDDKRGIQSLYGKPILQLNMGFAQEEVPYHVETNEVTNVQVSTFVVLLADAVPAHTLSNVQENINQHSRPHHTRIFRVTFLVAVPTGFRPLFFLGDSPELPLRLLGGLGFGGFRISLLISFL